MKKILFLLLSISIVSVISCNSNGNSYFQQSHENDQNDLLLKSKNNNRENYTFQLQLEGIRYDSLLLGGYNIDRTQRFIINGESTNGSYWIFIIPDSVFHLVSNFIFVPNPKYEKSDIRHRLILFSCQNGDTVYSYGKLPINSKNIKIYAKYLDTQIWENTPMFPVDASNEEYVIVSLYSDRCEIFRDKSSDLEEQGYYPTFPYIPAYNKNSYENYISQCIEIIKKYPDSQYLMKCVAENKMAFKTKESLQKIFDTFSKKINKVILVK